MFHPDVQPRDATLRDLVYFSTPRLWTTWPFLPLVRRQTNGECECGVLYDCWSVGRRCGYRATVFKTNIFLLPRDEEQFLALPKEVFDTPEELADAGCARRLTDAVLQDAASLYLQARSEKGR